MSISPSDPAVSTALAQALGHPGPFSQAECAALRGPLALQHARDLTELQHCTGLRSLEISASAISDLAALSALKELRQLIIIAAPVADLGPLRELPALERLTLNFTHTRDLSPLLALPALTRAELLGNPLTDESYELLQQQPSALSSRKAGRPLRVLPPQKKDWQTTRQLWERGIEAGVARMDFREWYLVTAGLPRLTPGPCEAIRKDPVLLRQALKKNPSFTLETLFEHILKELDPPPRVEASQLRSRRPWGDAADAEAWVKASALDEATKAGLLRFVAHFPTLTFYQEPPELLDATEADTRVRLPQWLREIRQTLAWVMPGEPARDVRVRFQRFEFPGHAASNPTTRWYSLLPGIFSGEESQQILEPMHLMNVGISQDPLWSQLLVRTHPPEDRSVYDFAEEMRRDLKAEGRDTQGTLGRVFESYASMLAAIDAVRVREGEPLQALREPGASSSA